MNKVCISADDVRVSLVSLGLNVWHHVPVVKGVSRKEVAGSFLHCEYLLAFVLPSFHVTTFIMSVILPVGNKTIHLRKKIKKLSKGKTWCGKNFTKIIDVCQRHYLFKEICIYISTISAYLKSGFFNAQQSVSQIFWVETLTTLAFEL